MGKVRRVPSVHNGVMLAVGIKKPVGIIMQARWWCLLVFPGFLGLLLAISGGLRARLGGSSTEFLLVSVADNRAACELRTGSFGKAVS